MRRALVAGNWKMHRTAAEARGLAEELRGVVGGTGASADVVVCPTFTSLQVVGEALEGSGISLGAQNMHWEKEGAFTGEVSAAMILTIGCIYVILGHSERRQYFAETDESVNRKLAAALDVGLKPIVCIGETLEQREAGQMENVVLGQVKAALDGISAEAVPGIALAYEPIWAIGTGRTATPAQAEEVHLHIRQFLRSIFGDRAADAVRIQYGGSVKPDNASELFSQANIDGGLIGGASLEVESFAAIVTAAG